MIDQGRLQEDFLEEDVPERQQRFTAITDSVLDAIILINDRGEISFWNPASERIFGYKFSEAMGKNVHELLAPPEYQTAYRSGFKDFSLTGQGNVLGQVTELVARSKGGEEFPIELSLSAFQIDGHWHAVGIVRDINERKQAAEALLESEKKYRLLADNTKDVIWQVDLDLRFTYVSQSVEQLTGHTQDEWIGSKLSEHCDEENFMKMAQVLSAELSKGSGSKGATFEATLLNKKKEPVPVEISGKILFGKNGIPMALQGTTRDISERKRLEESVLRLASIVESSDDAIIGKTLNGIITNWNAGAEKLYGYSAEDIIGQNISILLPPESVDDFPDILTRLSRGEAVSHFETKRRTKDGGIVDVSLAISPIKTPEGQIIGASSTARDITDLKRLEKERLEIANKLLQAQKLESLNVMAGGIAHDFNNQLMVVLGNLDLVIDDLPPDSEARISVQNAIQASERMAELSRQMLVYTGSTLFSPADMDLNELLNRNLHTLKLGVSAHVGLDLELGDRLPHIKGDAEQIRRLVMNLLINASEAIGDYQGEIRISTGVVDCDESYLRHSQLEEKPDPGRFVFLEVKDTGCGMDAETIGKLFDPFFTTKFTGRGLGMAEVIGTVRSHRGALFVFSQIRKGTTIRVLFPVLREAKASSVTGMGIVETQSVSRDAVSRQKTILLVDDEELVRIMVQKRLETLGYKTITASDGEEGFVVFRDRQNEIDLVMLDFAMPKMNGVEVFRELIKIKPDVKVILCSGYTENVVMQSFPDERPAGVLHKPYKTEDMKAELKRLLGTAG